MSLEALLAAELACRVVAFKGWLHRLRWLQVLENIVFYDVYGCNQAGYACKTAWLHRKPRKYQRKTRPATTCNHPAFVSVVAAALGLHLLGLACQGATSVLRVVAWVVALRSS